MHPGLRRLHQRDFGVATDDDGVGVMPRVAPLPGHRISNDHETGNLVDDVVHPAGLERGAVAGLMPAAVGSRAV